MIKKTNSEMQWWIGDQFEANLSNGGQGSWFFNWMPMNSLSIDNSRNLHSKMLKRQVCFLVCRVTLSHQQLKVKAMLIITLLFEQTNKSCTKTFSAHCNVKWHHAHVRITFIFSACEIVISVATVLWKWNLAVFCILEWVPIPISF